MDYIAVNAIFYFLFVYLCLYYYYNFCYYCYLFIKTIKTCKAMHDYMVVYTIIIVIHRHGHNR